MDRRISARRTYADGLENGISGRIHNMSGTCYKCQRYLPAQWTIKRGEPPPDNSWHMRNVAPHAASGGVMMPFCYKCDPSPLMVDAVDRSNLTM